MDDEMECGGCGSVFVYGLDAYDVCPFCGHSMEDEHYA